MPLRRSVAVSLSPELHALAERTPDPGRYGNASEVARPAPCRLDEREQAFPVHREARHAASPSQEPLNA